MFSYHSNRLNNIRDTTEILNIVAEYAKTNSKLYIVVIGHSDFNEKSKKTNISHERAKKVKKLLMQVGISESMIVIREKKDKAPSISKKMIAKAKTAKEKEGLRRYNRKVDFVFESNLKK